MVPQLQSVAAATTKSGLQKEVLALYRSILRVALQKDRASSSSSSSTTGVAQLLTSPKSTTANARVEFRKQASLVKRKDFRTIEHYVRQGYKKMKTLEMAGSTRFRSIGGSGSGSGDVK